jgi:hypothetical protein
MMKLEAVIKLRPLPRGGVGGGWFIGRYHRVIRAYFDNIARETGA